MTATRARLALTRLGKTHPVAAATAARGRTTLGSSGIESSEKVVHRKTVGIVLFDEVEVLDYCGPFEVFSVTRLEESRRREQPSPFQVVRVAQTEQPIVTTGGMRVLPEVGFAHCPPPDILVVPGGWGRAPRCTIRRCRRS